MKKFLAIFLVSLILFSFANSALGVGPCEVCDGKPCDTGLRCLEGVCQPKDYVVFCSPITYTKFGQLVDAIINFIFTIAMVVAPLMVIIGAFFLLTAAGAADRIKLGKNIITYTLIGLAIVLLAKGLIAMIEQVMGVKIGG